jgi:hypothetical protein
MTSLPSLLSHTHTHILVYDNESNSNEEHSLINYANFSVAVKNHNSLDSLAL